MDSEDGSRKRRGAFTRLELVEDFELRAIEVRKVLWRFGRMMRSSTSDPTDYLRSEPVESIDQFLSHSWSGP
eukprot:9692363-Heterocapsa_arctica.AAC.1